jgi:glycosyltransferase involved in cell wall biosynthesis
MRILHIVHSFVPYTMAGTEVYSYNLTREQARRHKVFIFFRINNTKEREYSLAHKSFDALESYAINHTFRACSSFSETYRDDIIDTKFSALLDKIKPDIVHIHHLVFLSCGIVKEIKKRGIPIVYTLHDYWLICYRGQLIKDDLTICNGYSVNQCWNCLKYLLSIRKHSMYLYSILKKRIPVHLLGLLKRVHLFVANPKEDELKDWKETLELTRSKIDLFLAPSRFIRKKFIEYGLPEDKILNSPYGLDYRNFTALTKQESPVLRFGFMGTLLPMKGLNILISAFKEIKNKDTELVIYGKLFSYSGFESYPNRLKSNIGRDNRIKLKGGYDNKDIGKILSNIDVLIVPSLWLENAPLVIQEAFLSRTPVIASRIGGIPELVTDGVNGLLFNPGDAKDLQRKIQYIIDNRDILRKFSENIPKIKDIEDNAKEIEEIYVNLINKKVLKFEEALTSY